MKTTIISLLLTVCFTSYNGLAQINKLHGSADDEKVKTSIAQERKRIPFVFKDLDKIMVDTIKYGDLKYYPVTPSKNYRNDILNRKIESNPTEDIKFDSLKTIERINLHGSQSIKPTVVSDKSKVGALQDKRAFIKRRFANTELPEE